MPSTFTPAITLLDTIPGVDQRGAERWVAETGIDMMRYGTASRLAVWAGVAPGNDASAGKQLFKPMPAWVTNSSLPHNL
jgi:transposase